MMNLIYLGIAVAGIFIALIGIYGIFRKSRLDDDLAKFKDDLDNDVLQDDDGIIAVRKRPTDDQTLQTESEMASIAMSRGEQFPSSQSNSPYSDDLIVINILPANGKTFIGYELLQAILSSGMRYGDMNIFHRYQSLSGKGPILFSLASASEPGTFDIQKMGNTNCQGLTLFLRLSYTPTIDNDRFDLMLNTANQIAKQLRGNLFNQFKQPLSDQIITDIRRQLSQAEQTDYA